MEKEELIIKLKQQIINHNSEMLKKDNNFDFYEGRKVEAQVILDWLT